MGCFIVYALVHNLSVLNTTVLYISIKVYRFASFHVISGFLYTLQ